MKIYSIKNEKLNFFNRPVYTESFNEALSYVQNILMSDADRALIGLRSDLALYELGDIDFVKGSIRGYKKPVRICSLDSIFDTIPEDKIPRNERYIMEQMKSFGDKLAALSKGGDVNNVE